MSWSISTRNIARISSFNKAEEHWAANKPWRNENQRWRQLDSRRMTHKRLVRHDDGSYACVLYHQDMVTYRPDGGVALTCHDSVSSNAFAWCVKPRGCRPVSRQGQMFWAVMTDDGEHFYRQGKDALVLKPTASGNWALITEPATIKEWAYAPKQGAAVRKMVKPYAVWHAMTERLTGRAFEAPTYVPSHTTASNAVAYLGKPESYPMLANTVARPDKLRDALYLIEGARYRASVPFDRLPRRTA